MLQPLLCKNTPKNPFSDLFLQTACLFAFFIPSKICIFEKKVVILHSVS